jgi:beta-phosphoglucomutase-like phosphatase (HAD superfamily)/dTDP-glucose pyrophosphorylase
MNKIKAVIFDMDGVLIDAKEWHYEALNQALSLFGFSINRYDHLVTYDGLPTSDKLKMLTAERGLPEGLHRHINDLKQEYTMERIFLNCAPMFVHEYLLSALRFEGYKLAVASNSIRKSVEVMMQKANLEQYLEFYLSNQDVTKAKPNPEIYNVAIQRLGLLPDECLVVEDNKNGIAAAIASGAHVMKVETERDVTYPNVKRHIALAEEFWGGAVKLIIPIVENEIVHVDTPYGRSLYEIERKTILQYICDQLLKIKNTEFVFILNRRDVEKFRLNNVIKLLVPNAKMVATDGSTAGAACSCMLACDYFVDDEPITIVGGDQIVTVDLQAAIDKFVSEDYDGGVVCFEDVHPHWSFVSLNNEGLVTEVAEKSPISRNATTGFYYFKRTDDFVTSVFSMIKKKASVNGKYYVCPVYNELILKQKRIGTFFVDKSQYFNFSHQSGIEMFERYLQTSGKVGGIIADR